MSVRRVLMDTDKQLGSIDPEDDHTIHPVCFFGGQAMDKVKRYVPVVVRFDTDVKMRPMVIEFDVQHKFPVDQVLDIRRAACQSVGGVGDRYTCLIQGRESYLWMEKGRWFVAAKGVSDQE